MTRAEIDILWQRAMQEAVADGEMFTRYHFAQLVAAAERRTHQADIERWKAAAATAEKWRGRALSQDGDGRTVQRIQQEAASVERERFAQECIDIVAFHGGSVEIEAAIREHAQGRDLLKPWYRGIAG